MTTTIAAGAVLVAPGAAYAAETTTRLSADAMQAALRAVAETSTAAARRGWRAGFSSSSTNNNLSPHGSHTIDAAGGIVLTQLQAGPVRSAIFAVAGKGLYVLTVDGTTQAAAKMMGRPAVKFVFVPKQPKLDTYIKANTPTPMSVLTKDVYHAGTRTTHDDGSADYRFTADKGVGVVLHVDRAGVLTSARGRSTTDYLALDYQYGPQKVTLPAARATVEVATLRRAVAYLSMQDAVKTATDKGADETRWASRGKKVKVSTLRTLTRRAAVSISKSYRLPVTTDTIDNGIRVYATNPWTKKTIAYTAIVAAPDVVVERA